MMTLDEAIRHVEEVVDEHEKKLKTYEDLGEDRVLFEQEEASCRECTEEHRQLAGWLKDYKRLLKQTQWIPCSERLPKKSNIYWCTFGGTNLTGSDYYTTKSDAKKLFDDAAEEYVGWQSRNVIAWMPLPKPYELQESEE